MPSLRRSSRARGLMLSLAVVGISTLTCLSVASAAPAPSPVSGPGAVVPIPQAAPVAPDVVLYDQYDNDGVNGIVSMSRADNATLTAFAADDFVVPVGQSWSITDIDVREVTPVQNALSFNVFFYTNGAGDLPGTQIAARANLPYSGTTPDLSIPLGTPVVLSAGTYWVSVQGNESPNAFWFWKMRSVQSNAGAAFMEAGGYGTGCTSWARRATCTNTADTPDQMFRLLGTTGTTAVAIASFGATRSSSAVALAWRTASETQTLGFNVWRSVRQRAGGPAAWLKLNATLIRAKGSGLNGASYRYVDRSARRTAAYAYRLDAVNLDGRVQRSRVVSVARS